MTKRAKDVPAISTENHVIFMHDAYKCNWLLVTSQKKKKITFQHRHNTLALSLLYLKLAIVINTQKCFKFKFMWTIFDGFRFLYAFPLFSSNHCVFWKCSPILLKIFIGENDVDVSSRWFLNGKINTVWLDFFKKKKKENHVLPS